MNQVTGGTTYTPANPACTQANVGSGFGYSYNMLGGLACETYPSGRIVSYSYDNGGRVNGLTDGQGNSYASSITYPPQRALGSMTLGNNVSETWTYNSRLQVAQMATSGGFLTLNSLTRKIDNVNDTVIVYGTASAQQHLPFPIGQETQTANQITAPFQVMFGSTPATLSYWGLAAPFVGLYQFNIVVPSVPANEIYARGRAGSADPLHRGSVKGFA